MSTIRFDFNFDKLVQAVAYFAWRGTARLDKLKTLKLLYFADKQHLLAHGRPILGDVYFCMEHGPVPSFSKNVIDDVLEPTDSGSSEASPLLQHVAVVAGQYPEFVTRTPPDLDALSASERSALDQTIAAYGALTPWQLREVSHDEPCWMAANTRRPPGSSVEMPYELFFEGQSEEVRQVLELVRQEQENRDFASDLAAR